MYIKNIDIILYTPKYKAKTLTLFGSFDEVRTATEGSTFRCEGGKKLNKIKITKYTYSII